MTARTLATAGRHVTLFALGALSALGFAPWSLWPAALVAIALAVRLFVKMSSNVRGDLLAGWLFGFGHFLVGVHWIAKAFTFQSAMPSWTGWIAVVLLAPYLAVFPALAVAVAGRLRGRVAAFTIMLAASWVLAELLRGLVFSGFPWNPLGVMLLPLPALAGAASLIGANGLSALVLLAAGGLALMAEGGRVRQAGAVLVAVPLLAGVAAAVLLPQAPGATATRVDIVQANLGQDEKWADDGVLTSVRRHAALTPAKGTGRRILVWPEAAVPDLLDEMPRLRAGLGGLLGPGDVMLLGGLKAIRDPDGYAIAARNSLYILDPDGRILGRYDKKHLVPFGEFLPARPLLAALGLSRLAPGALDFWPGPGARTLALDGFPAVGPLICYEIIFPGDVADRRQRPRWLLNVSNDAWFSDAGAHMHLAQARLRAIEEGLPIVRSTPTGISAVIDARGQVTAAVPRGGAAALSSRLPAPLPPTLFAQFGLWLPLLLAVLLGALAVGIARR